MIQTAVIAPSMALRTGLHALLAAEPDIAVLAEASDLASLEIPLDEIDVFVMAAEPDSRADLEMLQVLGSAAVLLLVSDADEGLQLVAGAGLSVWGLLSLDSTPEELGAAVKALHQGLLVGVPLLLKPLFSRQLEDELALETRLGAQEDASVNALTEREAEVLQLLAQGLANKQIAVRLGISEHTVKFHVSAIYSKLGANSRTEAVRIGVRQGLIVL